MTKVHDHLKKLSYGQIWQDHLARMLSAGYSITEARASHRRWKSIGKALKAGRY